MRTIAQDDLNAAGRGLNMASMSLDELREVIKAHDGVLFASEVIVMAARQILAVKLFNCAR